MQQYGFVDTKSDTSLFVLDEEIDNKILLVYVDDLIITSNNKFKVQRVIASLHEKFALKDRVLYYFFGIEVHHVEPESHLSQSKYISGLLNKTGLARLANSKSFNSEVALGKVLSKFDR